MPPTAIDHVIVAVADLSKSTEPWRRLGLTPVAGTRHPGQGTENAVIFLGEDPATMFFIEFLAVHDRQAAAATARGRKLVEAIDAGEGLFRIVLEADDLEAVAARLQRSGTETATADVRREDGSHICDILSLSGDREASTDPRFLRYSISRPDRYSARRERGVFANSFALNRLDHLALVPPDMERSTREWVDLFDVPVFGEIRSNGLFIRQMKVGDAIVEFLGPDGPDSRLAGAAPGLRSMVACEVDDLDAAVATARERGFNPAEPAPGVLPGTRTATIPPNELSGVALQLLEYV